jgi:hypothetical protein
MRVIIVKLSKYSLVKVNSVAKVLIEHFVRLRLSQC